MTISILGFLSIMICTTCLSCQDAVLEKAKHDTPSAFIAVRRVDFFAELETQQLPAQGEKWFKEGLRCVEKRDITRAKLCYKKALLNGYPVSRQYLMPVGL